MVFFFLLLRIVLLLMVEQRSALSTMLFFTVRSLEISKNKQTNKHPKKTPNNPDASSLGRDPGHTKLDSKLQFTSFQMDGRKNGTGNRNREKSKVSDLFICVCLT